jgi:Lon protease-like protein
MAESFKELALFPLNTVLFPSATVRLHVFEDRYRQLVHDCLEHDEPFGIALIREGDEVGGDAEPYMVGTAVRILQVFPFEDGTMDVHVQGEHRFRIRKIDESRPYRVGLVEWVSEFGYEISLQTQTLADRARSAFEAWFSILLSGHGFDSKVQLPEDWTSLSFQIANFLPIENLQKQRFLETTDTIERLEALVPIIEDEILAISTRPVTQSRLTVDDIRGSVSPN